LLLYMYIACPVDNGDAVCLLICRNCLCVFHLDGYEATFCQHTDKIVGWTAAVGACGRNRRRRAFLQRVPAPHLVLHIESVELFLHIYIPSWRRASLSTVTALPFCCLCSDDALRGLNSWLLCVSVVSNPLTH